MMIDCVKFMKWNSGRQRDITKRWTRLENRMENGMENIHLKNE